MFKEEKCHNCGSNDYEVLDFFEDATDNGYEREWICQCNKCRDNFYINYVYTLTKVQVERMK